ncbi:MAG: hypothetical protein AB9873_16550 [Syntrophobacteraceae bacterium]
MKRRGDSKTKPGLTLMSLLALLVAFTPMLVHAVDPDTDADGFGDPSEGTTISTVDDPAQQDPAFRFTLVAGKKDLFVILRKAVNPASLITNPAPFEYIPSANVLSVHQIPRVNHQTYGRQVYSLTPTTQKAMRFTEDNQKSLDSGIVLGVCSYGTPNKYDDATIYTRRIKEWIEQNAVGATEVCLGGICYSTSSQNWFQPVLDTYIKHTIAHEGGHMMCLTRTNNPSYGGYHYKTGTGTIMDQTAYFTNKSGRVTWYIPTAYAAGDVPKLK